ncbi:MAG: Matrixin, partial [Planctomycetota bacterium]
GTMDLLTVLTHELGHVLGLSDLDGQQTPDRIMAGTLQPGQRRSVSVADLLTGDQPIHENAAPAVGGRAAIDDLCANGDSAAAEETTAATRIALDADAIVLQPAMGTRGQATNKLPKQAQVAEQGTVIPVKSQQELDLLDDLFTNEIAKGDILLFPSTDR